MEKRHRVFIAINLPGDIKKELTSFYDKWPELPAKWTTKDNLHITLEFLGDLTDVEIGDACNAVKEVAKNHGPFSINLNKILYGPPKKMPPRLVWVEGENSTELADLKEDLQNELLEKIRFRPDGAGFIPHITLARISEWEFKKFEPEERPEVNEDLDLIFTVESIEVMESEMKRGGPVYNVLEAHILGE
jgi:RNA 2',3'-cyclic 3'-phosphodiesterase